MTTAAAVAPSPVLEVRGLSVSIGRHDLLHDLTFTVGRGERVGLIGESGSGKSLTSLAVLGLLPEGARATGSVRLAGVTHDVVGASERAMASVRGNDVSMVFQEPMTALNPTMRVGAQVAETILVHAGRGKRPGADRAAVRQRVVALLDQVGLPAPAELARAYPHQLSGGQRQRVVVAIALANDPELLVCDEPTTALDVTVQAKVLDLIVRGVEARRSAMLFITHDLPVVATVCERVLVMYGGRIVEAGPVAEVFTRPRHRYTEGLLGASDLEGARPGKPLTTIPGTVPPAGAFPEGCVFRTRCRHATAECAAPPPWSSADPGHGHACVHPAGGER
ncbi:ABC transporter ATP-binding protein [Intrasporangium calvum]|uniref:ABC transporter ATP-binding protein n=1 Tax=Intrasporangium calvum TaxID=53358 RepID=UPI002FF0A9D0